jgi:leucyl-tRNA synthetase
MRSSTIDETRFYRLTADLKNMLVATAEPLPSADLEKIKIQQKEWIGKSEGINIDYKIVPPQRDPASGGTKPHLDIQEFIIIPQKKTNAENLVS